MYRSNTPKESPGCCHCHFAVAGRREDAIAVVSQGIGNAATPRAPESATPPTRSAAPATVVFLDPSPLATTIASSNHVECPKNRREWRGTEGDRRQPLSSTVAIELSVPSPTFSAATAGLRRRLLASSNLLVSSLTPPCGLPMPRPAFSGCYLPMCGPGAHDHRMLATCQSCGDGGARPGAYQRPWHGGLSTSQMTIGPPPR
uniref:Uncharacterized protein n=1 Tax=Leersia perrieri TaxID=77586 RepID=A0A0D9WL39_9ORYZ